LSFESQLESLGATIAQAWRYPDHHAYTEKDLRAISELRGALPVVTTYKDFIRLPERWRETLQGEVLVLGIKLELLKGRNVWVDALSELAESARGRRA